MKIAADNLIETVKSAMIFKSLGLEITLAQVAGTSHQAALQTLWSSADRTDERHALAMTHLCNMADDFGIALEFKMSDLDVDGQRYFTKSINYKWYMSYGFAYTRDNTVSRRAKQKQQEQFALALFD